jgi:hypothetical protein
VSSKKDFAKAAEIVRLSFRVDKKEVAQAVRKSFIKLFRSSPSFDEEAFRALCEKPHKSVFYGTKVGDTIKFNGVPMTIIGISEER